MGEPLYPRAPTATLVRAKLLPPRPGPWVRRPRLSEAAAPGPGQVLVLSAGPGWGKTALLRQLAAESAMPVAWLRVDELDAGLPVFARHLLATLELAAGVSLERAHHALQAGDSGEDAPARLAAALAEDLACGRGAAVFLIVDDLHHLPPHSPACRLLERLVAYAAGDLALAVAGRSQPHLPVARWLAEGLAIVMTAADLRFTFQESLDLAAAVYQLRLTPPELAAMLRLSSGWPVALNQLLDHRQRGLTVTDDLQQERLLRYMVQEVQSLPQPLREVLLYVALETTPTPEVCDAATGAEDGAEALAHLAALGFLTEPAPGEYRHEAIFQPLLALWARRQLGTAGVRQVHLRAAQAWQQRRQPAPALAHLANAGEMERCYDLAETVIRTSNDLPCLTDVSPAVLEHLLRAPADRAWIHLNNAYLLVDAGRLSEGLATASRAQSRFKHQEIGGQTAAALLAVRSLILQGRTDEAAALLDHLRPGGGNERPLLQAHRIGLLALLSHTLGESQRGDSYLSQAVASGRSAGSAHATLRAFTDVVGRVFYARGDFAAALRYSRWLQAEVAGEAGPVSLYARCLTALCLVRTGRATEALPLARNLLVECNAAHAAGGRILALTALAAAEGCLGRAEEGARLAAAAADAAQSARDIGIRALVLDWTARLQRWSGDAGSAVETAALLYHEVTGAGGPPTFHTAAAASLILAHLAAGDAAAAAHVLAEADPKVPAQAAYYRLKLDLAASLLDSDLEAAGARAQRAARQLNEVRYAWLERYESEWVHAALARTGARSSPAARRPAAQPGHPALPPAAHPVPTPALASLSEREEEILRLMLRGAGNREIARSLYISEGTVKSHVSSIFQKLGVHSRTQAVLLTLQFYRFNPP